MACFSQQGLGLGEIEVVAQVGRDFRRLQRAVEHLRYDRRQVAMHDAEDRSPDLAVHRIGDGLAHADVVERLHLHVEVDELQAARLHDADDGIGPRLLDLLDPTRFARSAGLVELLADEGDRGGVVGRDVAEAQRFGRRRALEVVLVGLEDDRFLRAVLDELEGAAADRVASELGAELLDRILWHDETPEARRERGGMEEGVGVLQVEANSQGIDDVDRSDVLEARTVYAAQLGIELALIGILHVLRRNLSITLVPLHARLQLEGPGLLVG